MNASSSVELTVDPIAVQDVIVGSPLPVRRWAPTHVQLFRFSSVTWNAHRIHFDAEYARHEGYPGVLVQAHLHGAFLADIALRWAGPGSRLIRFRWENRSYVVADETVVGTGSVARAYDHEAGPRIDLELVETNASGVVCVRAWATVGAGAHPANGTTHDGP